MGKRAAKKLPDNNTSARARGPSSGARAALVNYLGAERARGEGGERLEKLNNNKTIKDNCSAEFYGAPGTRLARPAHAHIFLTGETDGERERGREKGDARYRRGR